MLFRHLRQFLDGFLIVLVGDGVEKKSLLERARRMNLSNVRFLEPYAREFMPSLLASADIALVPLRDHLPGAVPSKLYEAMGAGLPVVMVAGGEAAKIVRETQAGIVVGPGDVESLAKALRDLSQDATKRARLGANGRRAAVSHFDRRAIADSFIDLLEDSL